METTYTTEDIYMSAYLVTVGVELLQALPGRLVSFVFDNKDNQATKAVAQWRSGSALTNARTFTKNYCHIRRIVHTV